MMEREQLTALPHKVGPQMRAYRRWFHEYPELSRIEKETSAKILEVVKAQGLSWEMVGDYGIIARIEGGFEGKTVVLRADMDTLPVKESRENLSDEKASVSGNDGVSHACDYDAHMAMMLGAMLVLSQLESQSHGTVLVMFEQAEETGRGVDQMMEALKRYPVDICYATHVYAELENGRLCVQPGERMAALTSFTIWVKGKGGHASRPDLTVNPLMRMTQILMNLNSIWTGEINPAKTVTLGIGAMKCGEKGNVIADKGTFPGTMRYFDVEEGKKAFESVKRVCMLVAEAHRCTVESEWILQADCSVINDVSYSKRAVSGIQELSGEEVLADYELWFATESMGVYLAKYPGMLAFLGIRDEEHEYGTGHHTKEFDLDEGVLVRGCGAVVKYAADTLEER